MRAVAADQSLRRPEVREDDGDTAIRFRREMEATVRDAAGG